MSTRARVRSLLTLHPEIPEDSRIQVDWKVDVLALALPVREQVVLWRPLTHMRLVQLLIERLILQRQRLLTSPVVATVHE